MHLTTPQQHGLSSTTLACYFVEPLHYTHWGVGQDSQQQHLMVVFPTLSLCTILNGMCTTSTSEHNINFIPLVSPLLVVLKSHCTCWRVITHQMRAAQKTYHITQAKTWRVAQCPDLCTLPWGLQSKHLTTQHQHDLSGTCPCQMLTVMSQTPLGSCTTSTSQHSNRIMVPPLVVVNLDSMHKSAIWSCTSSTWQH